MKIKVLGAFGSEGLGQRPSAFLVNDRILVDAGTVPGALTVDEQLEVEHALLSHPHLDHVVGLAFLTDRLWRAARGLRGLRALVIECAFPNRLEGLAATSRHLTPSLIQRELDKIPPDLPIWIFHIKPQFYQETIEQLARIDSPRIQVLEQGKTYTL